MNFQTNFPLIPLIRISAFYNCIVISLILLLSATVISGQTIITDRPDQTESSSTIPISSLQVETGVLASIEESGEFTHRQFLIPTTLLRYGIAKGVELRMLSQLESAKNDASASSRVGISDFEIGVKVQFFQKPNINTEVAFLSHLVIPTGTGNISNEVFGTINKLSISHELNSSASIGYNVGYDYLSSGKGDLTYSVAIGQSVSDKVGVYIEPYGRISEFEKHLSNLDAGFTYLIHDYSQIDFSFGLGVNHPMNYISVGFSWLVDSQ